MDTTPVESGFLSLEMGLPVAIHIPPQTRAWRIDVALLVKPGLLAHF